MKRFLADALLVCILISIGSYIMHKDDRQNGQSLQNEINQFEEDIALRHEIKAEKEDVISLNDIEENAAGRIAKKSSEFVIDTIKGTVKAFSAMFDGITR